MLGGLEMRRARTVEPVPPGAALHQLNSVVPTGRILGSTSSSDCGDRGIVRF